MKKVLIAGKDSYIGTSFERWLGNHPGGYVVQTVDMASDSWHSASFAGMDTVYLVAGIAHVSADPKMKELYYKVNRDLAVECAKKAKKDGAKQFVFMSSSIVYGVEEASKGGKYINENTPPAPADFYGQSKWEADVGVRALQDEHFNVVIIRCPVVYGPGCKGNFPRLVRMARRTPLFPNIKNSLSMIYIDNLCEFVRQRADAGDAGIFFPQNPEYVSTSNVIATYRRMMGKKTWLFPFPQWCVRLCSHVAAFNKAFGTKVYDMALSGSEYQVIGFEESVRKIAQYEGDLPKSNG